MQEFHKNMIEEIKMLKKSIDALRENFSVNKNI